jgi:hypothetical protein
VNSALVNRAAAAGHFTGLPRRVIYRLTEQGHMSVTSKCWRLFYEGSELDRTFAAKDAKAAE